MLDSSVFKYNKTVVYFFIYCGYQIGEGEKLLLHLSILPPPFTDSDKIADATMSYTSYLLIS